MKTYRKLNRRKRIRRKSAYSKKTRQKNNLKRTRRKTTRRKTTRRKTTRRRTNYRKKIMRGGAIVNEGGAKVEADSLCHCNGCPGCNTSRCGSRGTTRRNSFESLNIQKCCNGAFTPFGWGWKEVPDPSKRLRCKSCSEWPELPYHIFHSGTGGSERTIGRELTRGEEETLNGQLQWWKGDEPTGDNKDNLKRVWGIFQGGQRTAPGGNLGVPTGALNLYADNIPNQYYRIPTQRFTPPPPEVVRTTGLVAPKPKPLGLRGPPFLIPGDPNFVPPRPPAQPEEEAPFWDSDEEDIF